MLAASHGGPSTTYVQGTIEVSIKYSMGILKRLGSSQLLEIHRDPVQCTVKDGQVKLSTRQIWSLMVPVIAQGLRSQAAAKEYIVVEDRPLT